MSARKIEPKVKMSVKRRWPAFRWLAALGLVGLLLLAAQCGSPANLPPTPRLPARPAGPVVRAALLSPTSGEMATFGRMMRNGATMAFEEWNNQGGVRGRRLEWVNYDTRCDFDQSRQAVQEAIDDGLQFIVGPLCSEAAVAAAALAESAGVLLISPTATHPLVTVDSQGRTRSTIFRASYVYDWQARAAACFARQRLGADTAALLFDPRDDYERSLVDAFGSQFTAQGGEIRSQATVSPGEPDVSAAMSGLKRLQPDIIYLPAQAEVVNRVAAQLTELGLSKQVTLLGSERWESEALDRDVVDGSFYTTHFVPDDPRPVVQRWAEAYKADYAIEPDTLAALGYDATTLLMEAIARAATFDPETVAQSLARTAVEGVTGQISFDRRHNPVKPVPVVHLIEGRSEFVTLVLVDPLSLGCGSNPGRITGGQPAGQSTAQ